MFFDRVNSVEACLLEHLQNTPAWLKTNDWDLYETIQQNQEELEGKWK